jgi:hypothetical protein
MEEARLVRTIEDDLFRVQFFFECNRLMIIDIEGKALDEIPAVDLENKAAVSQWCHMIWANLQRTLMRVPERTLAMPVAAKATKRGTPPTILCPTCKVPLVEKKPCSGCGGNGKPVFRCPKCGTGYKTPDDKRPTAGG